MIVRRMASLPSSGTAPWLRIALVGIASLLLSRAFACAMPLAGLATLAALTLRWRHAASLVLFVWLANQAVGFALMGYPHTASTIGWGVAIGLSAFAALCAARAVGRLAFPGIVAAPAALVAAFAAYEAVLLAATSVLPSGSGAFAPAVVLRIFCINAAALGLLLAVHRLADASGRSTRRSATASRR